MNRRFLLSGSIASILHLTGCSAFPDINSIQKFSAFNSMYGNASPARRQLLDDFRDAYYVYRNTIEESKNRKLTRKEDWALAVEYMENVCRALNLLDSGVKSRACLQE